MPAAKPASSETKTSGTAHRRERAIRRADGLDGGVAQHAAEELARAGAGRARRPRHRVDEHHLAWQLVDRQRVAAEVHDLLFEPLSWSGFPCKHDIGARGLPAHRVRDADDAAVGHGGGPSDDALDLLRPDTIAPRLDEVVLSRQEGDVALLVHRDEVAGKAPALADGAPLLFGIAPVERAGRALDDKEPDLAGPAILSPLP